MNQIGDLEVPVVDNKYHCPHCLEKNTHTKNGKYTYVCGYAAEWASVENMMRVTSVCERTNDIDPTYDFYVKTGTKELNRLMAKLGRANDYHPNSEDASLDEACGLRFGLYGSKNGGRHEGRSWKGHIELLREWVWKGVVERKSPIKSVEQVIKFLVSKEVCKEEFRVEIHSDEERDMLIKLLKKQQFEVNPNYETIEEVRSLRVYFPQTEWGGQDLLDWQRAEYPNSFASLEDALSRLGE